MIENKYKPMQCFIAKDHYFTDHFTLFSSKIYYIIPQQKIMQLFTIWRKNRFL